MCVVWGEGVWVLCLCVCVLCVCVWGGGCVCGRVCGGCIGVGVGVHACVHACVHVFVHACMTDKVKLLVSTVHSVAVGAQCPLDRQQ